MNLMTFFKKAGGFIKRNFNELRYFWNYALFAKKHFTKYRSTDVIMLRLDLIGDCTMFTDAALAIRKFYKDRKLTVVCLSVSYPVFDRLNVFDEIIVADFKPEAINWSSLKKLISRLREKKYDILLQPQASKFPLADILAAAVKCNKRLSIEPFEKNGNSSPVWIKMTKFLYNELIPYPRGIVSEFEYYKAFVREICDENYKTSMPYLPYREQNFIKENYYVIYPGGSLIQKYYPLDRYADIAEYIYGKTRLSCVILASNKEIPIVDDFKSHINEIVFPSIIDLTGRTTIYDVIDIIGNAKFVLTNDTSGVHIAAATGTPSVVVVGGWHFRRFLPYSIENIKPDDKLPKVAYTEMPCYYCNWNWDTVGQKNPKCLELLKSNLPSACMPAVTVEQIKKLVDEVIEENELC